MDLATALRRLEIVEEENEDLRERIRQLEGALGATAALNAPVEWRLTAREATVFGVIASRELATKEAIMAALYHNLGKEEAEIKIVDVFICKIRKKLAPFGIVVETVWGQGYRLSTATKQHLRTNAA